MTQGADGLAVDVRALRKSYGGLAAVDCVDFTIRAGEIFALLGPNGAGKTTTIEILEGYRQRDGGSVTVLGIDPANHANDLRRRIGIVLQSSGVDRYLTVEETIAMYSGYYPHPRPLDEVVALVGLEEKRHSRVLSLSGGQQRRLDMAIALAGDPDLLFLDEPTTGFDPSARREAWEVVRQLARLGKTVLLTTHYMDEAQYLADTVAVIAAGRIVATGDPATLGGRDTARPTIRLRRPAVGELPAEFAAHPVDHETVEIEAGDMVATLHRLTEWAIETGADLDALSIVRPTLEDVYLDLTGEASGPPPAPSGGDGRRRGRRRR